MDNPKPVPVPTGLVVKKGLKMRFFSSSLIPPPLSAMRIITDWAWEEEEEFGLFNGNLTSVVSSRVGRKLEENLFLSSKASMALETMFIKT